VPADVPGAADLDRVRCDQATLTLNHRDPATLDQPGEALEQPGDDAVLVGVDPGHVDAVERRPDPELLRLAGRVGDLCGVQQRLGGDAADVQAGAADLALLDERDAEAELCSAQRARIATRPCPEYHHVELAGLWHCPSALLDRLGSSLHFPGWCPQ
jgi:hypothetical protein